jgi:peptide/nickel transport system ATP-binding protein
MAVMLITHAMGVVAEVAEKVVVMYAGKVVEEAPVASCSPIRGTPTPRA